MTSALGSERRERQSQSPAWLVAMVNVVIVAGLLWLLSKWLPLAVGLVIVFFVVWLIFREMYY